MEASIVDLRYKMNDVLKALGRNERVKVFYHGKVRGTIVPDSREHKRKVADNEFFGMNSKEPHSVEKTMDQLRGGRYNAL